jgi:hypothetical protein
VTNPWTALVPPQALAPSFDAGTTLAASPVLSEASQASRRSLPSAERLASAAQALIRSQGDAARVIEQTTIQLRSNLITSSSTSGGSSLNGGAADAALFQVVLSALALWSGLILINELKRVNGLVWAIFTPPR